jgi:VanZ family protein
VAALLAVPTVLLMLSDRAPGLLRRLSDRLEVVDPRPGEVVRATGVPDAAFAVHVAVWGAAGLVVVLLSWSWRSLLAGLTAALVVSGLVEVAQEVLTDQRAAQGRDLLANAVGLALGAAVGLAVWAMVRIAGR